MTETTIEIPTVNSSPSVLYNKNKTRTKPNKNTAVIDRVFAELGTNQLHFDSADTKRRPHFCRDDVQRQPLILHIDDDQDLLDALSARLKNSGFRVACAVDGVPGMQAALAYTTDCIVLDYDMPGARGDEVIKALKSSKRTKDIPIIVLTAINKKSLRRRMLSMGANAFISKPFEFGELHQEILRLIDDTTTTPEFE